MEKVLFLLNDSSKYNDLIRELIDAKVMVNILDNFTTGMINLINEMDYKVILVEDDLESKFQVNFIRLLARKEKDRSLILISDYQYQGLESGIDEIIPREKLLKNYIEIFKKYGVSIESTARTEGVFQRKKEELEKLRTVESLKRKIYKKVKNSEKNIILVDDDEISIGILDNILREEGYKVTTFKSGMDALTGMKKVIKHDKKVDLFILDLMMPVMDGFTLLRNLRRIKKFKETPVLISSARRDADSVEQVARYSVRGYLVKPYDKELILDRVETVIEEKRKRDE